MSEIPDLESLSQSDDGSRSKNLSHQIHTQKEENDQSPRQPLARSKPNRTDIILTVCFDLFLAFLAIIFFVFGAFASYSNHKLVSEVSYANALLSAIQLVSDFQCLKATRVLKIC